MSALTPTSLATATALAAIIATVVMLGFALTGLRLGLARPFGWALVVGVSTVVEVLSRDEPPLLRMVALIAAALLGLKAIVVVEERARGMPALALGRYLAFTLGWLGMQPRLFASPRTGPRPEAAAIAWRGLLFLVLGLLLLVLARQTFLAHASRPLTAALALPGLSLVLHFGICNLLTAFWRFCGFDCPRLFAAPLATQSLGEFWSKRWNLAFSEMTAIAIYRPLAGRCGRAAALLAGFGVSGLLHELAISVPVRQGFGLPLLYFLAHGGLVLLERQRARLRQPVRGWPGRIWTLTWLALPLPLLFHPSFLAGVVWPLLGLH